MESGVRYFSINLKSKFTAFTYTIYKLQVNWFSNILKKRDDIIFEFSRINNHIFEIIFMPFLQPIFDEAYRLYTMVYCVYEWIPSA